MTLHLKLFKQTRNFCWFQSSLNPDASTLALNAADLRRSGINPEYGIVVTIAEADEPIMAHEGKRGGGS